MGKEYAERETGGPVGEKDRAKGLDSVALAKYCPMVWEGVQPPG